MKSSQDIPKTRRKQNGDVHPLVVIRFYDWIVLVPDFLPKAEEESCTVAYSLVLRPDPPEKEGPGIHCLRMHVIIQNR